jgi:hypothetical protein
VSRLTWYLQVLKTTWVRWGYGPQSGSFTHASRALVLIPDGHGGVFDFPFELPDAYDPARPPQEYERVVTYGWRMTYVEDCGSGHEWRLADSVEAAVEAARRSLSRQRFDTQRSLASVLTDVRVTDETASLPEGPHPRAPHA